MATRLDPGQVIKKVYDAETESIRTLTEIAIADIVFEVHTDRTNDSITVFQPNHDDLNVNANVQQGNADVGVSNPLYTQTTNGALETTQQQVLSELQSVNSELDSQTTQLIAANSSLDAIESDADAIRIAVQSIDTDFDVALSTRATEATQLANNSELQAINSELDSQTAQLIAANSSLDAIEVDADFIRIAVQSIDTDFDVALSTRATEVTQLLNNSELQDLNTRLEYNNMLYSRILPVLSNANWMVLGNFDSIQETFLGNTATLSYKEDSFEIGKATVEFNSATDWNLTLERYILDDDGSQLLDDDDTALNLD